MKQTLFISFIMLYSVFSMRAMTIEEVRCAQSGAEVTTSGTVTYFYGKNLFISDHQYGLLIYCNQNVSTMGIQIQDSITVSGTFKWYYGSPQISNPTIVNQTQATTPVPIIETTLSKINEVAGTVNSFVGEIVKVKDVRISRYDADGNVFVTNGVDEMECYYMRPNKSDFPIGKNVSVTGVVCMYQTKSQLTGSTNGIEAYGEDFIPSFSLKYTTGTTKYPDQVIVQYADVVGYIINRDTAEYNLYVPATIKIENNTYTTFGIKGLADFTNLRSVKLEAYTHYDKPYAVIADFAFQGCKSLETVELTNYRSIGMCAFNNCERLSSIIFGRNDIEIGDGSFMGCKNLESITIPSSAEVGKSAFSDCSKLKSVTFDTGSSPLSIKDYVFAECTSLESISIPNSVQIIGVRTFYGCSSLPSLLLSANVTSLGAEAFKDCTALQSITCEAIVPPTCGIGCFDNVNKSIPLYIPQESLEAYKVAEGWKDFFQQTAINNKFIETDNKIATKFFRNGQLFIQRGNELFNAQGVRVE